MPSKHSFTTEIRRAFTQPYLLYLPAGYTPDPDARWPLIFFLHGAGERGDNLDVVRKVGLPPVIEAWAESPFIVVAPQCPVGSDWLLRLDAVQFLLDWCIEEYGADESRIYLTGLSMGGRAAITLAGYNRYQFAALAAVCPARPAGLFSTEDYTRLKNLPTRLFHGTADEIIPVSETEHVLARMQAAGVDVRATYYEGVGHDAWTAAYGEELFYWFLNHQRIIRTD